MRNFFWEGFAGGKINHLVKWSLVSLPLKDRGLGLGGVKTQNSALLAKWGWRYSKEVSALWRKIICSIHGKDTFDWVTLEKSGNSLRSPWVNISRMWRLVEHLAHLKLGSGSRIGFWTDSGSVPLLSRNFFLRFSELLYYHKAKLLIVGIIIPSWSLSFRRSLKEEEIIAFGSLLALLAPASVFDFDDSKVWSIGQQGRFSIKSLSAHLNSASPMEKKNSLKPYRNQVALSE